MEWNLEYSGATLGRKETAMFESMMENRTIWVREKLIGGTLKLLTVGYKNWMKLEENPGKLHDQFKKYY